MRSVVKGGRPPLGRWFPAVLVLAALLLTGRPLVPPVRAASRLAEKGTVLVGSGDFCRFWAAKAVTTSSLREAASCAVATGAGEAGTGVILLDFSAVAQERAIALSWQTASEIDLVGFYLYRSTLEEGPLHPDRRRADPGRV